MQENTLLFIKHFAKVKYHSNTKNLLFMLSEVRLYLGASTVYKSKGQEGMTTLKDLGSSIP